MIRGKKEKITGYQDRQDKEFVNKVLSFPSCYPVIKFTTDSQLQRAHVEILCMVKFSRMVACRLTGSSQLIYHG